MPPVPLRWVGIRDPQNKFRSQALRSTDLTLSPTQIVTFFGQRWQGEVTFPEVRTPLGVETQRQWADVAIARTTPTLLGLFSVVPVLVPSLSAHQEVAARQAAWYAKSTPTFAEALALVRSHLWRHAHFSLSRKDYDLIQIPRPLFECLTDTLCYAAWLDKVELRAYPNNPAARNAMRAQAKCRKARELSADLSQRSKTRRKRFLPLCVRSTTQRRALTPAWRLRACASSPRARRGR
jgi:hypothetical protein